MIIQQDVAGQPIVPEFILANKAGQKFGRIDNVTDVQRIDYFNSPDEFSFTVSKYSDDGECAVWDKITDFKEIYVPETRQWYEISINVTDDQATTMSVDAIHLQQAELSQLMLYETEINSADDIARDDYDQNHATRFWNPQHPNRSLLHRILNDKAQHYHVEHVDASLVRIERSFSFDDTSIHDALMDIGEQIGVLFKFGEVKVKDAQTGEDKMIYPDDGKIHRTISAYDLMDYCKDCGTREEYMMGTCPNCGGHNISPGYGKDTGIFVSPDNIGENLNYDNNKDQVKTCFRLSGGDDDMTATIINCNPNGSQYIWHFNDDMRADMSPELQKKLKEYDDLYAEYYSTREITSIPSDVLANYHQLYNKYKDWATNLYDLVTPIKGFETLMRDYYYAMRLDDVLEVTMHPFSANVESTTAEKQCAKLISSGISSLGVRNRSSLNATSAVNAIIKYTKCYVPSWLYKISTENSTFDSVNKVWKGRIRLQSYTDDEDYATTGTLTIGFSQSTQKFVQQEIDACIANNRDAAQLGAKNLFAMDNNVNFSAELKKYSLDNLDIFRSVADACIDVYDKLAITAQETDVKKLRQNYYDKGELINQEIAVREKQVAMLRAERDKNNYIVDGVDRGLLDYLDEARIEINKKLDVKKFLGDTLWEELAAWRREDSYNNDSITSEDLDDSEIIDNAMKFMQDAKKEIVRSSTLQHSITGNLKDFLLLDEFAPLKDHFEPGNWLHLMVDGKIFKLRLTEIQVDYTDLTAIQVTFSDVIKGLGTMSDIESIFEQTKSIATSYSYVQQNAYKGYRAKIDLDSFVTKGLDMTNKTIVSTAEDQQITIDERGILGRRHDDVSDTYDDEQIKIIANGLYYTNDNWKSIQAGIGHYKYLDPQTIDKKDQEYRDGYGVIAQQIVGNIILGQSVGIYNSEGSFQANKDGVTITTNAEHVSDNTNVFTVRKKNADGTYDAMISCDKRGNINIKGTNITIAAESVNMSGGEMISRINLDDTGASINAPQINVNGLVKFMNDNQKSITQIDGGIIQTGTLSASTIKGGTLDAQYITVKNLSGNSITTGTLNAKQCKVTNLDADNITTGTLSANYIDLAGWLSVKSSQSGSVVGHLGYCTGSTDWWQTEGIGMSAGNGVVMATSGGAKMRTWRGAECSVYENSCTINAGNINLDGTVKIDNGHGERRVLTSYITVNGNTITFHDESNNPYNVTVENGNIEIPVQAVYHWTNDNGGWYYSTSRNPGNVSSWSYEGVAFYAVAYS